MLLFFKTSCLANKKHVRKKYLHFSTVLTFCMHFAKQNVQQLFFVCRKHVAAEKTKLKKKG